VVDAAGSDVVAVGVVGPGVVGAGVVGVGVGVVGAGVVGVGVGGASAMTMVTSVSISRLRPATGLCSMTVPAVTRLERRVSSSTSNPACCSSVRASAAGVAHDVRHLVLAARR
jgi:hypothetical protein